MKAEELMIGDWFRYSYTIDGREKVKTFRISQIENELGKYYVWGNGFGRMCYPDRLEPIPITPEILEKNGFKQDPKSRSRKSHQIITNDVYISWWKGRLNIMYKPFVGHSTNHINCDGKYVHELQHALRLAGIEKKIVL